MVSFQEKRGRIRQQVVTLPLHPGNVRLYDDQDLMVEAPLDHDVEVDVAHSVGLLRRGVLRQEGHKRSSG